MCPHSERWLREQRFFCFVSSIAFRKVSEIASTGWMDRRTDGWNKWLGGGAGERKEGKKGGGGGRDERKEGRKVSFCQNS